MTLRTVIIFIFSSSVLTLNAQKLSFSKEGTFKIVQFTDMHYVHGNPQSDTTMDSFAGRHHPLERNLSG